MLAWELLSIHLRRNIGTPLQLSISAGSALYTLPVGKWSNNGLALMGGLLSRRREPITKKVDAFADLTDEQHAELERRMDKLKTYPKGCVRCCLLLC